MKVLVSYATDNYRKAQEKLHMTGQMYFDTHVMASPEYLPDEFKEENKALLSAPTGAGYWLWKSKIIQMVLQTVNEGDFVFYIDAGNEILSDLSILFTLCKQNGGILLFDNRDGSTDRSTHKNNAWIKRDTFIAMGCDSPLFYDAPHVDASYQLYQKNDRSEQFIQEYLLYCLNASALSNAPSVLGTELSTHRAHRNDQAILSLLARKHEIPLAIEPSEWGNGVVERPYAQLFWHYRR